MNIDTEMKGILNKNLVCEITTKKFRNKKTGEIKTQLNIFELGDYEEI